MRYYTLRTIHRRGGVGFQLRDLKRNLIGNMEINSSLARHECELSEPDFLNHAKGIAELCAVPQCAVYVAGIREEAPARTLAPGLEVFANTPFLKIRAIAKREGVDISKCKTNAERAAAINQARKLTAA